MVEPLISYEITYAPQGTEKIPFRLHLTLERDIILKVSVEKDGNEDVLEKHLEGLGVRGTRAVLGGLSRSQALSRELAFMQGVERLLGLTVPPEVCLLRVLFLESERVIEHLQTLSWMASDVRLTPVVCAIRRLLRVFRQLAASVGHADEDIHRSERAYLRGFLIPGGFEPAFLNGRLLERLSLWFRFFGQLVPPLVRFIETLLLHNPLFQDRTIGLGTICAKDILLFGLSGPTARASEVVFDHRLFSESDHAQLGLKLPKLPETTLPKTCGDVFARTCVRISEIYQSLELIAQTQSLFKTMGIMTTALHETSAHTDNVKRFQGPWNALFSMNYPVKNVASFVEAPSGELGFFLVSHGETSLYRCRMVLPSFKVLQALESLLVSTHATDLALILHSLAIIS